MFKKVYMRFKIKSSESLDDLFARFHKILSNLHAINVTFSYAENARQLVGAIDMSIWEMKITSTKEYAVMSTLTLDLLYSKFKTYEWYIFFVRKHGSGSECINLTMTW